MGALAAAVTKQNQDATPAVTTMLNELTHRGNKGHGLATPTAVTNALTIENLATDLKSNVVIGHNYSKTLPRDILQPVHGDKYTLIFEGHQYPAPNLPGASDTGEMLKKLGSNPTKNAYNIVEKTAGSYVFAVAQPDRLTVGRDVFGTTSLYYAENDAICAVASERKALWKLGLTSVESFPPGHIATVTPRGFTFTAVKTLYTPPKSVVDMQTASEALELLLLDATRRQVSDLDRVAVAFSGGVDSSVVAVLAKNVGVNVQLVAVGLENQHDVELAEQAAEALELPLHTQTYTVDDLKQTLPKALWLTEENHAVNACISVPFYWLAQTTQKLGHNVLLAGQGADELFGGYQRYLTEYKNMGAEAVEKTMFNDVKNAYSQNFQRDNQICSSQNVELRLPYIDCPVVDFALRLPLRLKLASTDDPIRKRILRRVAQNMEIPAFIADKPKKAMQYTTGVTKALQGLAKDEGLTLREYVNTVYTDVFHS